MTTKTYDAVVVIGDEKKKRRILVANLKDDAKPEDAKREYEKLHSGRRKIESITEVGTVSPGQMETIINAVNNDEKPPMPVVDHV